MQSIQKAFSSNAGFGRKTDSFIEDNERNRKQNLYSQESAIKDDLMQGLSDFGGEIGEAT